MAVSLVALPPMAAKISAGEMVTRPIPRARPAVTTGRIHRMMHQPVLNFPVFMGITWSKRPWR